jgi:pimeloyl-ACP methyl ester carboxylesterase
LQNLRHHAGRPTLLIPGFASLHEDWRAEAERLKATHRVHLVQPARFSQIVDQFLAD